MSHGQDVGQGCSLLKAWLELEFLLPKWYTHLSVGWRASVVCLLLVEGSVSLLMELSIGLLQCSHNIVASFLRNKQSEESKTESVMSSCPNFRSCAPLCLQCLIGYTLVLFNVRRSYTKARRQDSLRPSCRLVLQVFKPKLFNYSWKFFILYQRLVHSFQFVLDLTF